MAFKGMLKSGMKVEDWPIGKVIPYARNPRVNEGAVAKVAASLNEFGWQQPIVVDEQGTVVVGHTRLLAAQALSMKKVPVHTAKGLSDAQVKAYRIADNKTGELAFWDDELLRLEFNDLELAEYDLSGTGFDAGEIEVLLAQGEEGLTDPDAVPEPPETPITQLGDVWTLGKHRLLCGDCTDADSVALALDGVTPLLMVTDPPYGVEYDPSWSDGGIHGVRENKKLGKVANDDRADWREAWALFPGDVAYVWHADKGASVVEHGLKECGFAIRAQIIWAKNRPVLSRAGYHWQHEPCWYAVRKNATGHWAGDRKQSTLWQIDIRAATESHGTQKPVECMRRPIVNNSSPGQAVYDPFLGSGTTLIAAEMEGRTCYGLEIDPTYCDVIVKRWEQFTGKQATRNA